MGTMVFKMDSMAIVEVPAAVMTITTKPIIIVAARDYLLRKVQMSLDLKKNQFLHRNHYGILGILIQKDSLESQTPICINGTTSYVGECLPKCYPFHK